MQFPFYILIGDEVHPAQKKKLSELNYVNVANMAWPSISAFNAMAKLCPQKKIPTSFQLTRQMFNLWIEKCKEEMVLPHMPADKSVYTVSNKTDLYFFFSLLVSKLHPIQIARLFHMDKMPEYGRISMIPHHIDKTRALDLLIAHLCAKEVLLVTNNKCKARTRLKTNVFNLSEKPLDELIELMYDMNMVVKPQTDSE